MVPDLQVLKIQSGPQLFENQRDPMQLSTCPLSNVISASEERTKCSGRSVSDFLEKQHSDRPQRISGLRQIKVGQVSVSTETSKKT